MKGFFSKCDQIRRIMRIWSYLLKKLLMENFNFRAVTAFSELHSRKSRVGKGIYLKNCKYETAPKKRII